MITIRRATLEDKPAIFAFLEKAYGDKARYKYPERWEWQFENNPFRDPDELPLWIAIDDDGKIIGQIGSQIEPLKINHQLGCRLYWSVDLVVLPNFRNQKIGYRLNESMASENANVIALPMSGTYRHYLLQMGAENVDVTYAYQKYIHLNATAIEESIERRMGNSSIANLFLKVLPPRYPARFLATVGDWILNFENLKILSENKTGLSMTEVVGFDSSIDSLWSSIADEFDAIVERTSQFLNWKYVQQPFMNYKLFQAMRENTVVGYVILRRSDPLEGDFGIIADLLCSPRDMECITFLIKHAIRWFHERKVHVVYAASSHPSFQKCYRVLKFLKYKEVHGLFKELNSPSELTQKTRDRHWFLGRSDHDWDQFPYA